MIQKCYVNNRRIQLISFDYKNVRLQTGDSTDLLLVKKKLYLTSMGDATDILDVELEMKVTLTNVTESIIDH